MRDETPGRPRDGSRPLARSTEVEWFPAAAEWYSDGVLGIDVSLLKRHLAHVPIPVVYVEVDRLSPWRHTDRDVHRRIRRAAPIDPAKLAGADPAVPLIFLDIGRRRYLVDGHHRLEQGRRRGLRSHPTVTVSCPEVARASTWRWSPPAVHWWTWTTLRRGPPGMRGERSW